MSNFESDLIQEGESFDFPKLIYLAKKSFGYIALILFLSWLIGFLVIRYTAPNYETSAQIQISVDDKAQKVLNVDNFHSESRLEADVELLRSALLFEKALEKLPIKVRYFSEGKILTQEKYRGNNYEILPILLKDSSLIGTRFHVIALGEKNINITYTKGAQLKTAKVIVGELFDNEDLSFQLTILNPISLLDDQNSNSLYFEFSDPKILVGEFIKGLRVIILNKSAGTIKVGYESRNSAFCKDIVDAIVATFSELDVQQKSKSSANVLNFISTQIDSVYHKLRKSELEVHDFKKRNKIKDFEFTSTSYLKRINLVENELIELELDLKLLDEIKENISIGVDQSSIQKILPALLGSNLEPVLADLVRDLQLKLLERNKFEFEQKENNLNLIQLNKFIRLQVQILIGAIDRKEEQLINQREVMKTQLIEMEKYFFDLPEKELEYTSLRRQYLADEKYFALLLQKKTEFDISKAGYTTSNKVLGAAGYPKYPISPNTKIIYGLAFFLGVLGSILLVVIRYFLNNEINDVKDIEAISRLPILGVVPKTNKAMDFSKFIIKDNPKSITAEYLRVIRTNLQFISNDPDEKLISITSTISGEGKTFIAINLAGIIAYSGKKVVVLDLDLRKPKVHLGFESENTLGMSNILIGKSSINDCISSSNFENLDYIVAGSIPPNPSELILSDALDTVLDELKKLYDYIIIDTPPIGIVTDGVTILKKSDVPIYILRANYTKRDYLKNAERMIKEHKINKMSLILNYVEKGRGKLGYGYGGYGQGYGYMGYFEEEDQYNLFQRIKRLIWR